MTDADGLWLAALGEVSSRAAHELKNALNGVHLNVEAIRSRSARQGTTADQVAGFANSAGDQLESVTARAEALLFLARPHREPAAPVDVAMTLRQLATLLVPATKSDRGTLAVAGHEGSAPTSAPAPATRLALAAGLLALTKEGGISHCRLEPPGTPGGRGETVVRFSHESAVCTIPPAVATAIAEHQIRTRKSGSDLLMVFPGS